MDAPEARLILVNAKADRLRYASSDDEAAFMYEAAANAEGVGHARRDIALTTAQRFANRAIKNRRLAEALTVAIARLPEGASEPAPLPDEEAPAPIPAREDA